MPYISIRVASDGKRPQLSQALAEGTTAIMADVLGKQADLTAVSIEYVDSADWFTGGQSVKVQQQSTAFISAKISAGTNSKQEIEQAVDAFFALLCEQLGTLSETSYVVIDEVPMAHWGYGGRTQQARSG